jgi:Na+-exporting ATPase
MGETALPTVEETSPQDTEEPPIRPYHGPQTIHQQHHPLPEPPRGRPALPFSAWHTLPAAEVAQRLGVDISNGLHPDEAQSRLEKYGPNKVKGAEGLSLWAILLRQVSNSLTLVLLITMGLSFGINDYIEGGVITAVILLNIVVG